MIAAKRDRAKEAGRLLARIVESRFFSHHPLMLSHLITGRCNCACETCLWRRNDGEELTTDEVRTLYRDARRSGFIMNALWGGEPLLREDLPEVLRCSGRNGLVTTVITNGYFLPERAPELRDTDSLIVSLDLPSEDHDRLRGCPGLFRRTLEGMEKVRTRYPAIKVMINTVISKLNADKIPEMVRLADKLGLSIYLSPMETGAKLFEPGPGPKEHLALASDALATVCREAIALKKNGFPINNSIGYLQTFIPKKKAYVCHTRKVCVHVNPNGDLVDCLHKDKPVANVRDKPFAEVLRDREYTRIRLAPTRCHVCNNADVIDCSYIWRLRPESLMACFRLYVA
jgi:MoaA/NifB/PqqE/SkfB family radical SAM enzyme